MSEEVDQRIERKLRWQHLRWLAKNKPDTFCFRERWRHFRRRYEATMQSIFRSKAGYWLTLVFCSIAVVAMSGLLLWVIGALCWGSLQLVPTEFGEVTPGALRHVGFMRLSIMQTMAWVVIALVCLPTDQDDKPKRQWSRAAPQWRQRVLVLRIAVALLGLYSMAGIGICVWNVTSPIQAALAGLLVAGLVIANAYCVSLWATSFPRLGYLLKPQVLVTTLLLSSMLLPFLFFMTLLSLQIAQHFGWWGPVAWMQWQVMRIGDGDTYAWLPLLVVLAIGAVITLAIRGRANAWQTRRKALAWLRSTPQAVVVERKVDNASIDLRRELRRRLHREPRRWHDWVWPRWMNQGVAFIMPVVLVAIGAQAVLYFSHQWAFQITSDADHSELLRTHLTILLPTIAIVMGTVEAAGFFADPSMQWLYWKNPRSPWAHWRQMQWAGLKRAPVILLWTLPTCIVPWLWGTEAWQLALLTMGMTLLACVSVRTIACAWITILCWLAMKHTSWATIIAPATTLMAMGLGAVAMLTAVADPSGSFPDWFRMLAGQAVTLTTFTGTAWLWNTLGWLPVDREGESLVVESLQ
ncbi:hypothetical protein AB1L30_17410 [Bremerella sp. JC817]|uniref:hypothetical protein n=1 Tax=Bremerella sp. JC817 TaxID=3231756 RepID=UPI00345A76BF